MLSEWRRRQPSRPSRGRCHHRDKIRRDKDGNGADIVDLEVLPDAERAREGAVSVHHVAFEVENRAAQLEVRKALLDAGAHITPFIDRNYF